MFTPMTDVPDGVIGFEVTDKVHADDYREVLLPALDEAAKAGKPIRCVIVFAKWDGMSLGGAWEDLRSGMKHLREWERIALVTDIDWMTNAVHLFGWLTPGEVKVFRLAERGAAVAWAAG
jgi:hypothetical protein